MLLLILAEMQRLQLLQIPSIKLFDSVAIFLHYGEVLLYRNVCGKAKHR